MSVNIRKVSDAFDPSTGRSEVRQRTQELTVILDYIMSIRLMWTQKRFSISCPLDIDEVFYYSLVRDTLKSWIHKYIVLLYFSYLVF